MQFGFELKKTLHKDVYGDFLTIIGQSYMPLIDEDASEETKLANELQFLKLKEGFHFNIMPKIEEKIFNMSNNLRITFAIAEGKTTEELNEY